MSMLDTQNDVVNNIGKTVKFTTLNQYETRLVEGCIEGVVKFHVARSISDIISFQAGVYKNPVVNSLPKLEDSSYVIIKTTVDGASLLQAYSTAWITTDDWMVVEDANDRTDITIKLVNVTLQEVDNALLLLTNSADRISAVVIT